MPAFRFDWRWVALIVFVAVLANARQLPWPVTALAFAAGGGLLLWRAWQAWGLGGPRLGGSTRVTYWRGQRIETAGPSRRYRPASTGEIVPVVVYGLLGLALAMAALVVALRGLGLA